MTSCNTLRRQQQLRVIGQIVVWLHKSIRVWHRLMFGAGEKGREPKTLLGLSNCEIVCRAACLCVCHSVCVLCCCCCRTLQQHFRRKAVNLSNVCTLSPYRQTRQLPLPSPSPHCAARQGRHTPRGPTHWTGIFWKTHYALRHFRGEPPYCETGKGTVSLSVKFSKQCAIRAVMRFPQERESARRASSAFSAASTGNNERERE